jgi:solute carrier family 25, member 34/35
MVLPLNSGKKGVLYANGLDCIVKTVKAEGFAALYKVCHLIKGYLHLIKGFSAHYLRIGPHTILTFVFLEQLKALVR